MTAYRLWSSRMAAGVSSLAVLKDGRLASGGEDGKIKLWPKEGPGEPVVLAHGAAVWSWRCWRTGGWPAAARTARSSCGPRRVRASRWCSRRRAGLVAGGAGGRAARERRRGRQDQAVAEGGAGEPVVLSHGGRVMSLAVLADGRLASGGDDGKIKLWPKEGTGEPVVLAHGGLVRSLAVLADGRLASGGTGRQDQALAEGGRRRAGGVLARTGRSGPSRCWRMGVSPAVTWTARSRAGPEDEISEPDSDFTLGGTTHIVRGLGAARRWSSGDSHSKASLRMGRLVYLAGGAGGRPAGQRRPWRHDQAVAKKEGDRWRAGWSSRRAPRSISLAVLADGRLASGGVNGTDQAVAEGGTRRAGGAHARRPGLVAERCWRTDGWPAVARTARSSCGRRRARASR